VPDTFGLAHALGARLFFKEMIMPMISDALQIALLPIVAVAAGSAVGMVVGSLLDWTLMNDSYRRKLAAQDREISLLEHPAYPALIQYYRNELEKERQSALRFPACSIGASIAQPNPPESHPGGDDVPERATGRQ
jgi:hypothetical protein